MRLRQRPRGAALALPLSVPSHHRKSAVPAQGSWAHGEGRWGKAERALDSEPDTQARGPAAPCAGHVTSDLGLCLLHGVILRLT